MMMKVITGVCCCLIRGRDLLKNSTCPLSSHNFLEELFSLIVECNSHCLHCDDLAMTVNSICAVSIDIDAIQYVQVCYKMYEQHKAAYLN